MVRQRDEIRAELARLQTQRPNAAVRAAIAALAWAAGEAAAPSPSVAITLDVARWHTRRPARAS